MLTLLLVGITVGLSYLARRARQSRGLEAMLKALMVLGGLLQLVSALLALSLSTYLAAGLCTSGIIWTLLALRRSAALLLRPVPLDPDVPVHRLAAAVAMGLTALNLAVALSWSKLAVQVEVTDLRGLGSLWLLLVNDIGLIAVALAGVGWPEDRTFTQALDRLGINGMTGWGLIASIGVAVGLVAFGIGIEAAAQALGLAPDRATEIAMRQMAELAGRSPLRIAVIAGATGLSEELLFRGALQPRLGLLLTSLVFASFHVQYGVGLGFLEVAVAGVALGVLRDRFGTLSAAVAHGLYNAIVLAIVSLAPLGQG